MSHSRARAAKAPLPTESAPSDARGRQHTFSARGEAPRCARCIAGLLAGALASVPGALVAVRVFSFYDKTQRGADGRVRRCRRRLWSTSDAPGGFNSWGSIMGGRRRPGLVAGGGLRPAGAHAGIKASMLISRSIQPRAPLNEWMDVSGGENFGVTLRGAIIYWC